MKIRLLLLLVVSHFGCSAYASDATLALMPYPQKVLQHEGSLVLDQRFYVVADANAAGVLRPAIERFLQRLATQTQLHLSEAKIVDHAEQSPATYLKIILVGETNKLAAATNAPEKLLQDESYRLQINADHMLLQAHSRVGVIRGLETLLQLVGVPQGKAVIAQLSIDDAPRFAWRGVLLDSARHFLSVATIKRQIDGMAAAKYNVFHWHLTDDQGWRFASKKFPKLQQLASNGQFYSQEDMREVVAYAHARGIHVLPEIDFPGHASALAIAYPELMSAPGPYREEVRWGVHKPLLNPANKAVYVFIDSLIGEVSDIFPFEYIHIGGDEVDPQQWQNNPEIQTFMQQKGLVDAAALHVYFNQRLVNILAQHQRKMIGWDEVQHADLPRDIVIQSWRGPDAVGHAVRHGFQAILSTGYYLDQPQPAAYHYRNDPLPARAVVDDKVHAGEKWWSYVFAIPRKRGSAIAGSFTLIEDQAGNTRGFIDFVGKSRGSLEQIKRAGDQVQFRRDTWMGEFHPRLTLRAGKLSGEVIVGNAPYTISGRQSGGSNMPGTEIPPVVRNAALSAAERNRVLGGEAALWGELVDDKVIDLRLWPRAFAVAERLWSPVERRDEADMYLRLSQVSDWSEVSVGLQHKQQSRRGMAAFVAQGQSILPLQIFAEALEPAQYYHRQHEKSARLSYSRADPLNLLVDTLPAQSDAMRALNAKVEQFLQNPSDKQIKQSIVEQLERWRSNHVALMALIKTNPRLANLAPLARQLDELADLGTQLLPLIADGKALSPLALRQAQALLQDSRQIQQEMILSATYAIEKLVDAAR